MSLEQALALADTIVEFERRLPGWWWSVSSCSVTRDASCGPDRNGPDADLLRYREFDAGFHHDGEGDVAESLRIVMERAVERRTTTRSAQEPASGIEAVGEDATAASCLHESPAR
jgi:hypothetical protein